MHAHHVVHVVSETEIGVSPSLLEQHDTEDHPEAEDKANDHAQVDGRPYPMVMIPIICS